MRFKVRLLYQRGFQVVDGSTVLASFENHHDAFRFVHARGARAWLEWGRTEIGGQTGSHDFCAKFLQETAGRIYKYKYGPSDGRWFWAMTYYERGLGFGNSSGTIASKDEAVAQVEQEFTRFMTRERRDNGR